MKLAINHIEEMMTTYNVKNFQKMALPRPIGQDDLVEHRRIDIDWCPGSTSKYDALFKALEDYQIEGYRTININVNGLTSDIRLTRGALTAEEEYRIKLESSSLVSFKYNDNVMKMHFAPRYGDKALCPFELDKLPFLRTIKDYEINYGLDYVVFTINSFHPKDVVKFIIKDSIEADIGIKKKMGEDRIIRTRVDTSLIGSDNTTMFVPENWGAESQALFDEFTKSEGCPDCKDGFYYPLIGEPEPCQTCNPKETTLDIFVQDVGNIFCEKLYKILCQKGLKFKGSKNPQDDWWNFCVDLNFIKDYDRPESIAAHAASMSAQNLKRYIGSIVFKDIYTSELSCNTKDSIHIRPYYKGVSALVSMKEINGISQFQFQVKVSS